MQTGCKQSLRIGNIRALNRSAGRRSHGEHTVNRVHTSFPKGGSQLHMSADLTKGSFGHFSSFNVIKILRRSKISIFCTFLEESQTASYM